MNRRDFLKAIGSVGIGSALLSIFGLKPKPESKGLRIDSGLPPTGNMEWKSSDNLLWVDTADSYRLGIGSLSPSSGLYIKNSASLAISSHTYTGTTNNIVSSMDGSIVYLDTHGFKGSGKGVRNE